MESEEEEETEVDQRNGASQELILKQNKLCESQSQIKKNELIWKERCAELDLHLLKPRNGDLVCNVIQCLIYMYLWFERLVGIIMCKS